MRINRARAIALATLWAAALGGSLLRAAAFPGGDPVVPHRLSETGLYAAGSVDIVDSRNRPFSPQYPLWTDGAAKSRWIYLPPGTTIDASDPLGWAFPVGTRFWKEFRFAGRKVETRMLWRASDARWLFASYHWNDAQTDAELVPADGLHNAVEVAPGRFHSIPAVSDCAACHGTKRQGPLGFNALQLSTDRDPGAIHGEPLRSDMTTLATLSTSGLLSPAHPELIRTPPKIRTTDPRTRSLLGYFMANCGTCHNRSGEIGPDAPSLHYSDLIREEGDEVIRRLAQHHTMWQVPGQPDGASVMLDRTAPERSAMLARMRSRRPSSQMPPLGTVIRDEEAIAAIEKWIGRR
jgi:mono/diheme cytochrome c family protein